MTDPQCERVDPDMPVRSCRQTVAFQADQTDGLVIPGQERLRLARGFAPPHDFLAPPCVPTGGFPSIVYPFVLAMFEPRRALRLCRAAGSQFMRDKDPGLAPALLGVAEEAQRRSLVAARLDQGIEHTAIDVHGPPKPVATAFDPDHDLIKMPLIGGSRTVAQAQGSPRVDPNGEADDALGKSDAIDAGQTFVVQYSRERPCRFGAENRTKPFDTTEAASSKQSTIMRQVTYAQALLSWICGCAAPIRRPPAPCRVRPATVPTPGRRHASYPVAARGEPPAQVPDRGCDRTAQ